MAQKRFLKFITQFLEVLNNFFYYVQFFNISFTIVFFKTFL